MDVNQNDKQKNYYPSITSRRLTKNQKPFDEREPHCWFANSLPLTEFFHTFSILFPEGEAYFIRSVAAFANDPRILANHQLATDVKAFIAQEVQHSAEHSSYNKEIGKRYNHDMVKMERFVKDILSISSIFPSTDDRLARLAVTCSLEHLTAIFAEILLDTDIGRYTISKMSPSHRSLWIWHAIEETEHKSVAFDVYQKAGGGYLRRIFYFIFSQVIFFLVLFYVYLNFMKDSGNLLNFLDHWQLFKYLYIYPGYFSRATPLLLKYVSPNFHPWGGNKRIVIKDWLEKLEVYDKSNQFLNGSRHESVRS